jgi:hypothetical protein
MILLRKFANDASDPRQPRSGARRRHFRGIGRTSMRWEQNQGVLRVY